MCAQLEVLDWNKFGLVLGNKLAAAGSSFMSLFYIFLWHHPSPECRGGVRLVVRTLTITDSKPFFLIWPCFVWRNPPITTKSRWLFDHGGRGHHMKWTGWLWSLDYVSSKTFLLWIQFLYNRKGINEVESLLSASILKHSSLIFLLWLWCTQKL